MRPDLEVREGFPGVERAHQGRYRAGTLTRGMAQGLETSASEVGPSVEIQEVTKARGLVGNRESQGSCFSPSPKISYLSRSVLVTVHNRGGSDQSMKTSMGTLKKAASFFAWDLLIERLSRTTSEATPLEPNNAASSVCFVPRSSINCRRR